MKLTTTQTKIPMTITARDDSDANDDVNNDEDDENTGDEFDDFEDDNEQSELIHADVLQSFGNVHPGETGYATVVIENFSETGVVIGDLNITSNQLVEIDFEDCTAEELAPDEMCFIDLVWTPDYEGKLRTKLRFTSFDGQTTTAHKIKVAGASQTCAGFNDTLEIDDAEFDTDHDDIWEVSEEDVIEGDDALETEVAGDGSFSLSVALNNQEPIELSFWYFLEGASGTVFVNDVATYELASTTQWSQAVIQVPAEATVRIMFNGQTANGAPGTIRLDNFSESVVGATSTSAASSETLITDTAVVQSAEPVSVLGNVGAGGSTGQWMLTFCLLLLGFRKSNNVILRKGKVS